MRYHALRQRFPDVPIMMGVGNLTELVEADTSGINALLFGMAAELKVSAVLTTQVSLHARRAVREADMARRLMHAAATLQTLPKGLGSALATVHERHPVTDTPEEIQATAAQVKDPNFRIQVSGQGLHVYNRDGLRLAQGRLQPVAATGLAERRRPCLLHGGGTGASRTGFPTGQALCAGPALELGCGLGAHPRQPGRLVRAGQHPTTNQQER